jgi:hypothetical protein
VSAQSSCSKHFCDLMISVGLILIFSRCLKGRKSRSSPLGYLIDLSNVMGFQFVDSFAVFELNIGFRHLELCYELNIILRLIPEEYLKSRTFPLLIPPELFLRKTPQDTQPRIPPLPTNLIFPTPSPSSILFFPIPVIACATWL